MVLSLLTDSYLLGDNILMGLWGLECPLSSLWARPGDIEQSRNLPSHVGRSGALLNHRE